MPCVSYNSVTHVHGEASISKVLFNENHRHIGQYGLAVEDGCDATDPLGRITVITDSRFSAWKIHTQTPGPHGGCDFRDPFYGRFQIRPDLVHPGDNNHLFRTKCHRVGPITNPVNIHDLSGGRDGIGTTEKAVTPALFQTNVEALFRSEALLPVIQNFLTPGIKFLYNA
jgi:hypothetical protein